MMAAGTQTESAFSLRLDGGPVDEPIITPWQPWQPSVMADILSSPSDEPEEQDPIWRVNLPASAFEARAILNEGSRALAVEERVLLQTSGRLELLAGDLSTAGPHHLQGLEAELIAELTESGSLAPVSFDVESGSTAGLADRGKDWLRDTWERLKSLIARTTWTETVIDGRLIARSALGRTGDTLTAWIDDVTDEEASRHNQAVRLALASKQALVRKVSLVIRGALMITRFIAAPGSALLAIPAIWRYLNQLRAELVAA